MDTGTPAQGSLARPGIDRISPNDLTTLVSDRGPAPMNIAAVLVVDGGSALRPSQVVAALQAAAAHVPRLRQRLQSVPLGCGRPYWVDDDFDIRRHVTFRRVADAQLWSEVAELVCQRLPSDRPLWRAVWLTGLDHERAALVVVAHHVLADGLGALAVLAAMTGTTAPGAHPGPARHTAYTRGALVADAWRSRARGLRTLRTRTRAARAGAHDLGIDGRLPRLCARTSLNRATGPRRRLTVVSIPLSDTVAAAHRLGATVNDLVLTAVSTAVAATLADRGEAPDSLVVSVPYSGRASTDATALGNQTGVVPFRIPLDVDRDARLLAVARMSRAQRSRPRAASAAPLGVGFRALARLGLLQWFVDRQRLVNTFVTNVHGPAHPWRFCGCLVTRLVPVAVTPGNVGATFDALSYAGTLSITVVTDPDVVPDSHRLASHLAQEFRDLTGSTGGTAEASA